MKILNVKDYFVRIDGNNAGDVDVPYQVRPSLINLLFSQQNLGAMDVLERDDVARKIRGTQADSDGNIALEDAEFRQLESAVKAFKGFSKNDVELVRRVLNASKT